MTGNGYVSNSKPWWAEEPGSQKSSGSHKVTGYDGQRREVDARTPAGFCRHLYQLDRQWCYSCPPGVVEPRNTPGMSPADMGRQDGAP